jgi:hypothetical protein
MNATHNQVRPTYVHTEFSLVFFRTTPSFLSRYEIFFYFISYFYFFLLISSHRLHIEPIIDSCDVKDHITSEIT